VNVVESGLAGLATGIVVEILARGWVSPFTRFSFQVVMCRSDLDDNTHSLVDFRVIQFYLRSQVHVERDREETL
jgi:hypothetical protein